MSIKLGIVGAGDVVLRQHLPILARLEEFKVVAICDPERERAEAGAALLPYAVNTYEDHFSLLNDEFELDAVLVATPPDLHLPIAQDALRGGLHVFVETPMAIHADDAVALVASARKKGRTFQVGLPLRHSPLFQRMAALVAEGAIGRVHMGSCVAVRPNPGGPWRHRHERGGGPLLEEASPIFDLFNWLFGQNIMRVVAFGGQANNKEGVEVEAAGDATAVVESADVPDNLVVAMDYDEGARASLSLTMASTARARLQLSLMGDEGLLVARLEEQALYLDRKGSLPERIEARGPDGLREPGGPGAVEQLRAFARAIRGEGPVACDVRLGLDSVWPAFMADLSLEQGRVVTSVELADSRRGVKGKVPRKRKLTLGSRRR